MLRNKVPILTIISIIMIAVETSIARLYAFLYPGPTSLGLNLILFAVGIAIFSVLQFFIIFELRRQTKRLLEDVGRKLQFIFIFMVVGQLVLTGLLFTVLSEAFVYLSYKTYLITATILLSYGPSILYLSILSERFIKWLINHRSYVSLLFGFSTISILVNSIFSASYVVNILTSQPDIIRFHVGELFQTISGQSYILQSIYSTSYSISYLLAWLSTVIILKNYSRKVGKVKFWLLVTLPLLYFTGQFQNSILPVFRTYIINDPVTFTIIYTLFFTLIKFAGAIFFGIGLWTMAKRIQQESLWRLLNISSYGLMLLFISNQAVILLNNLFPPIGLIAVSFNGLASFLLLCGTYSAALSVASDIRIRKSIQSSVQKEFELLGNIGQAEFDLNLRNKVVSLTKSLSAKLKEDTGVESSLTSEDIKEYTVQVIHEVALRKSLK